jgi:hypothetical protein
MLGHRPHDREPLRRDAHAVLAEEFAGGVVHEEQTITNFRLCPDFPPLDSPMSQVAVSGRFAHWCTMVVSVAVWLSMHSLVPVGSLLGSLAVRPPR